MLDTKVYKINIKEKEELHIINCNSNEVISIRYLLLKRLIDIVISSIAILFALPFILVICIIIKLTSKGPAIYKQKRIGKNGDEFILYKFRTMINGADNLNKFLSEDMIEYYNKYRKLTSDPRITKFGYFLRITSIDEIPQLFNILKGDMSLVGPRPMLPEEIEMYGRNFSKYIRIKPGLTGLWQINNRNKTTMKNRARIDCIYFKKMCLSFDLYIILKTVIVVLKKDGAC